MEANPVVALFLVLGIIITAARVGGTIARRFDQPRVLGELVIGVLLGPTLLDLLHVPAFGIEAAHLEETVHELAELGVLLLMFKVGLDVHLQELAEVGVVAGIAGVAGALLPLAMTLPAVAAFGYSWQEGLFAGVTLAATSVSISAQVLLELDVLRTREGNALLATALIDDVVAILLVSLAIAITGPEQAAQAGDLLIIVVRMAAYIGVASAAAWFVLPRIVNWIQHNAVAAQSYGVPAFALIMALLFGWSADYFGGVATITGAFIAGVGFSRARENIKRSIDVATSNMSYAFLVPIFFVSVGLQTDLSRFPLDALPFAAVLLLVAVASKVIGCGAGARLGGFNNVEALRLGVCMISRGEVGLIIASLGISSGILRAEEPLFAALFLVILLSTVLTPPLVRRVFQPRPSEVTEGV
ncbi:MAG: cation:proton antiporter [Chloroflexi bacterium]|nr:cation:proton antiporter [Chloroflexota bacterium]